MKKIYYKDINSIRVIACIAILFYHFQLLQGGFLAVCMFFVLSGYLNSYTAFQKDKFSLWQYYKDRFLKIYVPLLIVVFTTIAIVSFLPNIVWLNLKPETTSVLLGYNNFWQLGTKADYFTSSLNSPFIHLWYISILIQFELVFPFLFMVFKKIGDKVIKLLPCLLLALLSIAGFIYFYLNVDINRMVSYYDTFLRVFSLLFGVTLGFIHHYYGIIVPKVFQKKRISRVFFYCYLLISIILFILIKDSTRYFALSMLAITLISCRLIDYGTLKPTKKVTVVDKCMKFLGNISYEVYLVQYPIIYFLQGSNLNVWLKIPMMLFVIFIVSCFIHFAFTKKKSLFLKIVGYTSLACFTLISCYGGYQYVLAKDHTLEMKRLEEQLNKNEEIVAKKQEEYLQKQKQDKEEWEKVLEELENEEEALKKYVKKLSVVGIGDSVMLGAVSNLSDTFSNGYFDAKVSRSVWAGSDILNDLKNKNLLGDVIILALGTNGDCSESLKRKMIEMCGNRKVFWITVTNDSKVHINNKLYKLAKEYDNLYIIDWSTISKDKKDYFYADGIHLTSLGRKEYTKAIYQAIYDAYVEDFRKQNEDMIKNHEEELKNRITFYGNDLLLNDFEYIHSNFETANFIVDQDFTYDSLRNKIEKDIQEKSLTHKIVFAFDNKISLSIEQYQELISMLSDNEVFIVSLKDLKMDMPSVKILDFSNELKQHEEYLLADKIHLSDSGNNAFSQFLKDNIK